jgi:hypothetical protein
MLRLDLGSMWIESCAGAVLTCAVKPVLDHHRPSTAFMLLQGMLDPTASVYNFWCLCMVTDSTKWCVRLSWDTVLSALQLYQSFGLTICTVWLVLGVPHLLGQHASCPAKVRQANPVLSAHNAMHCMGHY